jgi:hypothetical protein
MPGGARWRRQTAREVDEHSANATLSDGAEWMSSTGPLPYWRGRLMNVHYDFAN